SHGSPPPNWGVPCDNSQGWGCPPAPCSNGVLQVIDRSGARIGEYEDVSRVEKYEMAESDYEKRPGDTESLRSFLRQRRWGRYDTEGTRRRADEQQQRRAQEAALAAALPLGARCQVRLPGQPSKLATIMYVGTCPQTVLKCQTDFKPGYWVGVRYDEPLGKHDGSVGGRRYFECQPKYGAFVKPQSVTPGDFPEEDNGLEDEL
uniref:CAP-Gly domain-containing protein n=1 Tax=Accipiter nisus TaxID=211598 RepID=A0A8B9MZF9_9AVES